MQLLSEMLPHFASLFIDCFRLRFILMTSATASDFAVMDYESAAPAIVKSIRQRDLLNAWLRAVTGPQGVPHLNDYHPERLDEERPDLVYYDITYEDGSPQFMITYHGQRLAEAFGKSGKGMLVDDVIGPKFVPTTMPIYRMCVARARPVYSIYVVTDLQGHEVAYERLLLPFSSGAGIDGMIASCKAISEAGAFVQKNLMFAAAAGPVYTLLAVIDRAPARPGKVRSLSDDVIEV